MAQEIVVNGTDYEWKYYRRGHHYDILLAEKTIPFDWNVIGQVYEFVRESGGKIWWAEGRKGNGKISFPGQTRKEAALGYIKLYLVPSVEEQ